MEIKLSKVFQGTGVIIRTYWFIAGYDLQRKCPRMTDSVVILKLIQDTKNLT